MDGAVILAAVAVLSGGAAGAAVVWFELVRPLQARVRAAVESTADMGWLLERQRAGFEEQYRALDGIVREVAARREFAEVRAEIAEVDAALLRAELEEARAGRMAALLSFGRQAARADALEADLLHEKFVADGLAGLFGGRSS